MLRKMFNNQAHVTHMTDAAFFQYYGLPSPQQLLWRLGSRMLLKYQSALWQLAPQDIVHYCDLTAWQATIHLLATSIQAPDPRRADLTSRPQHDPVIHFRCSQCGAISPLTRNSIDTSTKSTANVDRGSSSLIAQETRLEDYPLASIVECSSQIGGR